jgi:transposase
MKRNDTPYARARTDLAVTLILSGKSPAAVCKILGISKPTLMRLLRRPTFQARFERARDSAFERANNKLNDSAHIFAETLARLCVDPKSRDSAKATAARSGFDVLLRMRELFEFDARLKKIEAALEAEQK